MATIPRGPGASARRAEMMRTAWGRVEKHGSAMLGPVWDYVKAHPTLVQGAYYLLTGLWPIFSLNSFLHVTGAKTDLWLVQTVGALIAVVGATMCTAAYRRRMSPEVLVLAIGSAAVFAAAELVFVFRGTISAVYLLDAAIEVGLLALWAYAWGHGRLAWSSDRSAPPVAIALPSTPNVPVGGNGRP
ncbi:MAG TPA: hypothetical protein VMS17_26220 [Gemmataceae bacterium]|nr:hypothetical protein [Gemmataceae bacterium]